MRRRRSTLSSIDMEKRTVGISVLGEQRWPDGDIEKTDFFTEGTLEEVDGRLYLRYRESDLTGLKGTETEFCIEKDAMTLRRRGEMCSLLHFCPGVLDVSRYETPYGVLRAELETTRLEINMDIHGGTLQFGYTVTMERQFTGEHSFLITVKDEEERP